MGLKFRKFHFFQKNKYIFQFLIFNFKFKFKFRFSIFLIFNFILDFGHLFKKSYLSLSTDYT
jgi:hypothetical protein